MVDQNEGGQDARERAESQGPSGRMSGEHHYVYLCCFLSYCRRGTEAYEFREHHRIINSFDHHHLSSLPNACHVTLRVIYALALFFADHVTTQAGFLWPRQPADPCPSANPREAVIPRTPFVCLIPDRTGPTPHYCLSVTLLPNPMSAWAHCLRTH